MSYGISPIAVSLTMLQRDVIGEKRKPSLMQRLLGSTSPTDQLVDLMRQEFAYRFEEDEVDEEDEPSLEEALAQLLTGGEQHEDYGHKYGYALEMVCEHFGERLSNSHWSAMHSDWIDEVEQAMVEAGIDPQVLSVGRHLFYRGSPIAISTPYDFPAIGYMRVSEMPAATQAIDAGNLSDMDEEVRESVLQIRQWLTRCIETDRDLICFYY